MLEAFFRGNIAENVDDLGVIGQSRMVVGRGFKYFLRFEARFAAHDAIKFREVSLSETKS